MAKCDTLHCDNDADPETGLCGLCQGVEELDAAEYEPTDEEGEPWDADAIDASNDAADMQDER